MQAPKFLIKRNFYSKEIACKKKQKDFFVKWLLTVWLPGCLEKCKFSTSNFIFSGAIKDGNMAKVSLFSTRMPINL